MIQFLKNSKISSIVLWICMIVTFGIFVVFYFKLAKTSELFNQEETSSILIWFYILFAIAIFSVFVFSVFHFIKKWKAGKRNVFYPAIWISIVGILLVVSYCLGSGTPLEISGYAGKENTSFWLKITDMWIYCIGILLVFSFLIMIIGIIWSYLKKSR